MCEVSVLWVCSEGVGTHRQADCMAHYQLIRKKSRLFLPPVFYLTVGIITPSALWLTLQKTQLSANPTPPPLSFLCFDNKDSLSHPSKSRPSPSLCLICWSKSDQSNGSVSQKLWCVHPLHHIQEEKYNEFVTRTSVPSPQKIRKEHALNERKFPYFSK